MKEQAISIDRERGAAISARLKRAEGRELLVLLPGLTYTNDMPVMHFVRRLFEARGVDILAVDYRYDLDEAFLACSDQEQLQWIERDGAAILRKALSFAGYARLTVAAKSLGTIALGGALAEVADLAQSRLIWLTPSVRDTGLAERLIQVRQPAFMVIGREDPNFDPDLVERWRSTGMEVLVIDGADHGLERRGDTRGSLAVLAELVEALDGWLSKDDADPRSSLATT